MVEEVKKEVLKILKNDKTGHDFSHVSRVLELSLKFSKNENVDLQIVSLIALLHDVDDYKLFGKDNSESLNNARKIMIHCGVSEDIQETVCNNISKIGYRKRLKGYLPDKIKKKIVSDADMCDALGATGILRVNDYVKSHGREFFSKESSPSTDNSEIIAMACSDTAVCHIFEKLLKLKNMMLTKAGKKEAKKRDQIVVDFLYHLFEEENAIEWTNYLNKFLENR